MEDIPAARHWIKRLNVIVAYHQIFHSPTDFVGYSEAVSDLNARLTHAATARLQSNGIYAVYGIRVSNSKWVWTWLGSKTDEHGTGYPSDQK